MSILEIEDCSTSYVLDRVVHRHVHVSNRVVENNLTIDRDEHVFRHCVDCSPTMEIYDAAIVLVVVRRLLVVSFSS
jgi:hypothetical protein